MIRLRDLLVEYEEDDNRFGEEQPNRDERSTWRVNNRVQRFGAKNSRGQIRYFDNEADARKFVSGEIKGPNPGRPEPKEKAQKPDAKQYPP